MEKVVWGDHLKEVQGGDENFLLGEGECGLEAQYYGDVKIEGDLVAF